MARRAKTLVGVDLGATAVRVVQVSGYTPDSLAKVTRVGVAPTPAGAIVGGRVKDPAQVADALSRALAAAKAPRYGLVLGIASPDAVLVATEVPAALKPKEWESTLRLSGKPLSPRLPMDATALSLVALPGGDNQRVNVMAAGLLFSEVDSVVDTCALSKVTPRALDLSPAATMRCLTRVSPESNDVVTVVDVGASKTSVATRDGLYTRSARTLVAGGEDVTRAVMGATGLDFSEAERRKLSSTMAESSTATKTEDTEVGYGGLTAKKVTDLSQAEDDAVAQAVRVSGSLLVDQIVQAVESDLDRFSDRPTQGIVLAGGGALLQGLTEAISARTGLPTVIGRPWASVEADGVDGEDSALVLQLATAIGIGMWDQG